MLVSKDAVLKINCSAGKSNPVTRTSRINIKPNILNVRCAAYIFKKVIIYSLVTELNRPNRIAFNLSISYR